MRLPHPLTILLIAAVWIGILLYQVHAGRAALRRERERPLALENHRLRDTLGVARARADTLEGAVRQYIHAAAQMNTALEIVSGKLNQCEAVTY